MSAKTGPAPLRPAGYPCGHDDEESASISLERALELVPDVSAIRTDRFWVGKMQNFETGQI